MISFTTFLQGDFSFLVNRSISNDVRFVINTNLLIQPTNQSLFNGLYKFLLKIVNQASRERLFDHGNIYHGMKEKRFCKLKALKKKNCVQKYKKARV